MPFAGTAAALDDLLGRLAALDLRPGDEVLVADNRPGAGTSAPPPARVPEGVTVLPAAGPRTPYHARNVAAARAAGDWLVFLDADTTPARDLLDRLLLPPPDAAVGVLAGGIEDAVAEDTLVARYVGARRKMDQAVTLAHPYRPFAQTANCAVRRSAFATAGGFPPTIRSAGDADLCWRLQDAGWRLEARPHARVRHRNRASTPALLRQIGRHGSGMAWLDRRHPGAAPPPRPREVAGRVAHALRAAARARGEERAYALLDLAALTARDLGRLVPNRAPGSRARRRP